MYSQIIYLVAILKITKKLYLPILPIVDCEPPNNDTSANAKTHNLNYFTSRNYTKRDPLLEILNETICM